jgi:hypothetical protein
LPTDIDAASLLVAALALAVSGLAEYFSWRSSDAARRSAIAAETSATAADRSTAVAEREEQRQLQKAEKTAVRWRPEPVGATKMKYWNDGMRTAHEVDVEISAGASTYGGPITDMDGTVHPGDGITIGVNKAKMSGPGDESVTLTWRLEPGGRLYRWTHRL